MNGELINQLMEAVNRAMANSPEVRELLHDVRLQGVHVNAQLNFKAAKEPEVAKDWLEELYLLEDQRAE